MQQSERLERQDRHVPALDGVRGLAIIAVTIFHLTEYASPTAHVLGRWGWMGVDLFFVLSGYLITGNLLEARGAPGYYRTFYARRVLRIVPAYVVFLLVLFLVLPLTAIATTDERAAVGTQQGWYWLYLVNVLIAQHGWSAAALGTGPLWSLSVEEQFYLLWPFAVSRVRKVAHLALCIIVAVVLFRAYAVRTGTMSDLAVYVLSPTRFDALAWGALVAAIPQLAARWRWAIGLGGAILAAVLVRLGDGGNASPSMQILGYPALGLFGAGLVGYAITRPARWLTWRPLTIAGKYSYGFYLWHSTVFLIVARLTAVRGFPFAVLALSTTVVPVALSWILVERPALRLKRFLRPTPLPELSL